MSKTFEPLSETAGVFTDGLHRFNEDSTRLVHFLKVRPSDRVLDLGTGCGILAIYAAALYGGTYAGIDADPDAIALAEAGAAKSGLAIDFLRMDVADAPAHFGHGTFDRVIANPPYFTTGDAGARALQRHADGDLLSDWCRAAFLLLNNGGTLSLCYPADKLAALFRALDQNRLAPKRLALVGKNGAARLALVEAKKLGGDGVTVTYTE